MEEKNNVLSKYAWAVPLTDMKSETAKNVLEKIIGQHRTPHYLWIGQGSVFYTKIMKQFLRGSMTLGSIPLLANIKVVSMKDLAEL